MFYQLLLRPVFLFGSQLGDVNVRYLPGAPQRPARISLEDLCFILGLRQTLRKVLAVCASARTGLLSASRLPAVAAKQNARGNRERTSRVPAPKHERFDILAAKRDAGADVRQVY